MFKDGDGRSQPFVASTILFLWTDEMWAIAKLLVQTLLPESD